MRLKKDHKKVIKPLVIVLAVMLYWVLIYYPFHYSKWTPISAVAGGTILLVLGAYSMFIKKEVKFRDVMPVYIVFLILMFISDIFLLIAATNNGLIPEVDITLSWIKGNFGLFTAIIADLLGYPVFIVLMAGTYKLLDKEHLYLWIMVFLAWSVSTIRLFINFVAPSWFHH